ncbi:hypothetical protein [Amycolatopsis sp. CA-230715]|uniref:hypothetical protein n=1 Tax=Amycolatopsis sp. CA-230715 TaxID=2745196 RepID=UPI001C3257BA|nr:hypothetical protein [Amycolatopsis sp. CA-230715]QWF77721.1 hypothetical protein HUW46_01113 [Amycolatopsis sp. CA-230715]
MNGHRRHQSALVLTALAVALAGCSADAESESANGQQKPTVPLTSAPPSAPVSTTPEKPYLTTTPALELSDATTKPGTKLKFGEQAVIPFNSYYAKGLLGVSVTVDAVKAADADIDSLKLKDEDKKQLRGKTFFFVHKVLTNVDGANLAEAQAPSLWATTKSGGFPGTVFGIGSKTDVPGCTDNDFAPKDFSAKGARYETCDLMFGVATDPIVSLAYSKSPYEDKPTRNVTWRR